MSFDTTECRDAECRASIVWAVTTGRKNMPVNVEPDPAGNVLLTPSSDGGAPIATVVNPDMPPLGGWPGTLHTSHFATCPAADRWRHRKDSRG